MKKTTVILLCSTFLLTTAHAGSKAIVTDSDGTKCTSDRLLTATDIKPQKVEGKTKPSDPKWFTFTWKNAKGVVMATSDVKESDIAKGNLKIGTTMCYDNPDEGVRDGQ